MIFWPLISRKNKIEFFNDDPSIIDNFPIIESKELKLKWVKRAREDLENQVEKNNFNDVIEHISRCPGIFELFKYGYIIPLHKDIIIKPKGKDFEWVTPVPSESFKLGNQGAFSHLLAKPPWTADFIVKINTGWHVIAPKGVKFIMLPIAYPDTFDFTSTVGILNPALSTQINFQMFWNATQPETLIRAGTPLGQLIPLTEKKYQMIQRTMNKRDLDWVNKLNNLKFSSFWTYKMRSKVINMYNKYWKR